MRQDKINHLSWMQPTKMNSSDTSIPTNNFSKMKTFEQWNYGDGQRGILPSINKGIISYEKANRAGHRFGKMDPSTCQE